MMIYLIAAFCVLGIAIGQLLFKLSANWLQRTGNLFDTHTLLALVAAFTVYGITSLVWVWLLQKGDLGRLYPLMAFAFIVVPIGSHYFFGERFPTQYFVGITLIMTGIIITMKS